MRNTEQTLGNLVTASPAAAKVLQRYRLDYCCGRKQTLNEACAAENIDSEAVLRDIDAAGAGSVDVAGGLQRPEICYSTRKVTPEKAGSKFTLWVLRPPAKNGHGANRTAAAIAAGEDWPAIESYRRGSVQMKSFFYLVFLLGGLLAVGGLGCGEDDDDSGGTAADAGGDGEGARGGDAGGDGDMVTITYTLGGDVVDDFEFCFADDPEAECFTSDEDGVVVLKLPADSDVALTVNRDGFAPLLWLRRTKAWDQELTAMGEFTKTATAQAAFEAAGVAPDDSKGVVLCFSLNASGGTAVLSPESGEGPFFGEAGVVNPSLTEFSTLTASAWFFNVEPGNYRVTFEHPDRECTVKSGLWNGSAPNVNLVRVEAGYQTWGCSAPCAAAKPTYTTTREPLDDAAACEGALLREFLGGKEPEEGYPDCEACICANCLDEINACGAEPGCVDVVMCATAPETRCSGVGCVAADTCLHVSQGLPGGFLGAAIPAARAWGDCVADQCPDDCSEAALREEAAGNGS